MPVAVHSYTHDNQKYSVIVLKDGRAMEIRRGTMTFAAHEKHGRSYWPTVEAWKATWPTGATEGAAPSRAPRHPIIERHLRGRSSNMYVFPTPEQIEDIHGQMRYNKTVIAKYQTWILPLKAPSNSTHQINWALLQIPNSSVSDGITRLWTCKGT